MLSASLRPRVQDNRLVRRHIAEARGLLLKNGRYVTYDDVQWRRHRGHLAGLLRELQIPARHLVYIAILNNIPIMGYAANNVLLLPSEDELEQIKSILVSETPTF